MGGAAFRHVGRRTAEFFAGVFGGALQQTVVGVFARIVAKRGDFVDWGQRFVFAFGRADDLAVGASAV